MTLVRLIAVAGPMESSHWVDWIILLGVFFVIALAQLLSRNHKDKLRRRKSREIAEKAARAGDPFRNSGRVAVDPSEVGGLDQKALSQLTEEFERLGFVRVLDYRLQGVGRNDIQSFARAMVHPTLFCSSEIMATKKQLDAGEPLLCGLTSHLEEDWRIGSINRSAINVDYFQRLPKNIRLMRRGATPEQLLQRHMEVRAMITADLWLQVMTDLSIETKFKRSQQILAERREALLRCDILAEMADAKKVAEQDEWEWLGDYPQEKVRRLQGKKLLVIPEAFPTYEVPQKDAMEQLGPKETLPLERESEE
jgi:hypothetical protein